MTIHKMAGVVFAAVLVAAGGLVTPAVAVAAEPPTQISSDPFTNPTSQHQTQVEPDTFSFGRTEVAAVQSGRFFDGGSSNVGWATSKDGGSHWTHGFLPGTTTVAHRLFPVRGQPGPLPQVPTRGVASLADRIARRRADRVVAIHRRHAVLDRQPGGS